MQVADQTPFMEAGLDSLGAVELRNALADQLGVALPATATFDYPTIDAMATYISGLRFRQQPQAGQQDAEQLQDVDELAVGVAAVVRDLLGLSIQADQVQLLARCSNAVSASASA